MQAREAAGRAGVTGPCATPFAAGRAPAAPWQPPALDLRSNRDHPCATASELGAHLPAGHRVRCAAVIQRRVS
jgi:hypothetical protein